MEADSYKLLWDARRAAELVANFTGGKTFAEYQADQLLRSGVERQLAIVGEALNQLRQTDPATFNAIPEASRIVGFRNVLVHGYASVDNRIVWGIVQANLQSLLTALDSLLARQ